MVVRSIQIVLCALIVAVAAAGAYAAEDSLAEDNFLTNTINSVFDKVNKVASGEEGIIIKDYNKPDSGSPDYTTDALGRKIQEPTIRSTGALPPSKEEKAKALADEEAAALPPAAAAGSGD